MTKRKENPGMKGVKQRIAALITAAVTLCSMGTAVSAEFTDPAEAYANFVLKGITSSSASSAEPTKNTAATDKAKEDPSDTKVSDNSETAPSEDEELIEDELTEDDGLIKSIDIYSYKSVISVGDTFNINFRITPSDSTEKVKFSVSNSKVLKVSSKGKVTALKKGSATITVKSASGVYDRILVTVKDPVDAASGSDSSFGGAESIELMHSIIMLYEGESYQVRYELKPDGCEDSVTYKSSNKSVVQVSEKGNITALKVGTARVTCTTGSGVQSRLTVTVLPALTAEEKEEQISSEYETEYDADGNIIPSAVRFTEESENVQVGSVVQLDARIYPTGAKYTYTIQSDNPSVASVDNMGKVTGLKPGNAVITITTNNGKTDSVYVTVYGDVIRGIDVSKWNGDIDWKTVSHTGDAQFVMIRASYGYEDTDPKVEENVKGCEKYNIPYGFYHYMYATTVAEAKKEAAYFLNVIQNYSPEYPVVLDIEEEFYKQMDKKKVTEIVATFMEAVEDAGYYGMIYSYAKFFDDCLIMDKIEKYDIWVACWGDSEKLSESYSYHYGMWQYSETGRVDGIDEDVDLDYAYKDYKYTIRKYGLNNLK